MVKTESHIPKLRFAGFTNPWQKKLLSQISSRVQEKNRDNLITETFTNSAERGIINQRDFFDKDISNEANLDNYYVVQSDDFVYNPRISNFAPVGPIKRNKLGRSGVMSPLYSVFRPNKAIINFDFLEHYFSTTNWHKFMFTHGDQGARADRFAIGTVTFQKMPICVPNSIEQVKIGDFFQKIDQVIELQLKALETAQDYKKSMLQKLFPQKGEKVPKMRFDGFSEDWEERKLGDIGSFKNGLNKNKEDFGFGIPFINLMDVFGKNTITQCQFGLVNATDKEVLDYSLLESDVLFIRSSVKPEGVGLAAVILENLEDTVYSGFLIRFREFSGSLSKKFKCYCFNGYDFRQRLLSVSTSSANTNINQQSLSELLLSYPKIEEQQKIGAFFQKLDQQIEQHEKKLESYQSLKKAMLQRMFV